jgi:hypothetical protein
MLLQAGGANVLTEKLRQQILELYKESPRARLIAIQLKLPVAVVRRVINRVYPSAEAYPPNLVRDVILASRAGFVIKQVADRFGISESKVKRIRAEALSARERQPLGRPGSQLTQADDVRIRRKVRQFLRGLSQDENVGYTTLRRRLKKIL